MVPFEYMGHFFSPLRTFNSKERKASIYEFTPYIHPNRIGVKHSNSLLNDFYKASGNSECDVFRCVEDNKLYIPGDTVLWEYTEMEAV